MAACVLHVGDELGGIAIADFGVSEILEVIVVGSVIGEQLPVVPRSRVATPAHDTESAIGDRRSVLRISASVDVWADDVTITQGIHGYVDVDGGRIRVGRRRGRFCCGGHRVKAAFRTSGKRDIRGYSEDKNSCKRTWREVHKGRTSVGLSLALPAGPREHRSTFVRKPEQTVEGLIPRTEFAQAGTTRMLISAA